MGTERGQSTEESKNTKVHNTYIPVPSTWYFASYLVLLYVRTKAQRSTTQHHTAPQGKARHRTARHRTALRCAAELHIAGLSYAGGACIVIQRCSMHKPGVVV